MGDLDFLGAEGGRLAMAFAAGCAATFAFVSAVGSFIWRVIGKTREDRIAELCRDIETEKRRCADMELRLNARIEQLETVLLFETVGQVRQNATLAIAEIHQRIRSAHPASDAPQELPDD